MSSLKTISAGDSVVLTSITGMVFCAQAVGIPYRLRRGSKPAGKLK